MVSSGFSHFRRSLSFRGLLSWFLRYKGLLFFRHSSFRNIGVSWILFEIFLSLDKDISHVIMLSTFAVAWLFPRKRRHIQAYLCDVFSL